MKKLLFLSSLGLATLMVAPGQAQAADIVLDSFNNGIINQTIRGNQSAAQKTRTGSVAGPEVGVNRAYTFQQTAGTAFANASVFTTATTGNLSLTNTASTNSTLAVNYPSINYAIDGPGSFIFNLPTPVVGSNVSLGFRVNNTLVTKAVTSGSPTFTLAELGLPNDFNITQMSFNISSTAPQYGITMDQLIFQQESAVPEPMTILGTGFALASLPALKKAHNKKKA